MLAQLEGIILTHIVSLFIISAITKFISLKEFIQLVTNFHVLPKPLINIVGILIPVLELVGAVFLLSDRTRIFGSFIVSFLLILFSYAVVQVLKTKRRISCGCYGRFIDAEVDAFTMGKIVYFLILITFISLSETLELSVPSMIVGTSLTILVIAMQKVWQHYNQTLASLRKGK